MHASGFTTHAIGVALDRSERKLVRLWVMLVVRAADFSRPCAGSRLGGMGEASYVSRGSGVAGHAGHALDYSRWSRKTEPGSRRGGTGGTAEAGARERAGGCGATVVGARAEWGRRRD